MNRLFSLRRAKALTSALTLALAVTATAAAISAPATAHEIQAGDLTIIHPWVRLNIPGRPSAGYMVLSNAGAEDERLIGAHSAAFGRIELHTHTMENGVMKMGKVDAITAPAGGEVALKSGGFHMMMFDPTDALKPDEPTQVTLEFERAGDVEVWMIVAPLGAPDPDGGDMDHMNHDGQMDQGGQMDHGAEPMHSMGGNN